MFQIFAIFLLPAAIFGRWNVNVDVGCRNRSRWLIHVDFYNSTGHRYYRSETINPRCSMFRRYNDVIMGPVEKPTKITFYHTCINGRSPKFMKFKVPYSIFDYVMTRMDDLGVPARDDE